MLAITHLMDLISKELTSQHKALQDFNNPEHKDRRGAIGELVPSSSPLTTLQSNWVHRGPYNFNTLFPLCLQIGTATNNAYDNFNAVLKSIDGLIAESGIEIVNRHVNTTFIKEADKTLVIHHDVGSNYMWIGIRLY